MSNLSWLRVAPILTKLMLMSTFGLAVFFVHQHSPSVLPFKHSSTRSVLPWYQRPDKEECQPVSNVAFLKSHKCASSAIQNILFRYGLKHHLHFALPEAGNYFGGGMNTIRANMVKLTPWYKLGVNIYAIHAKWDHQEVKSFMPNDTIYITIVREPAALFESLFTYAKMDETYKQDINEYVATHDEHAERHRGVTGYNQMAWDFGLPASQINNLTAVKEIVERYDKAFHLVMVAERMDESLVLLSRLLCCDLKDVLVLKINARREDFKKEMNNETRLLLKQRQASDYFIYDHFARRFEALVEAYGRDRMEKDVSRLKEESAKVMETCNFVKLKSQEISGPNKPWSSQVSGYRSQVPNSTCALYTKAELPFIGYLRNQQRQEMMTKFGYQPNPGLDALRLGSIVMSDPVDVAQRIKQLQSMLVHKEAVEVVKRDPVEDGQNRVMP